MRKRPCRPSPAARTKAWYTALRGQMLSLPPHLDHGMPDGGLQPASRGRPPRLPLPAAVALAVALLIGSAAASGEAAVVVVAWS